MVYSFNTKKILIGGTVKLYYKPIVLGLAALALGSQVINTTTVLAGEVETDTTDKSDLAEIAAAKLALKEKMDKVSDSLKNLNGSTPATTTMVGLLTYIPRTVLDKDNSSLATLKNQTANFNETLNKYTINDIKLSNNGQDIILANVPLQEGYTTIVKDVPAGLVPDNMHIEVTSSKTADGQPTTTVVMVAQHVMGQDDSKSISKMEISDVTVSQQPVVGVDPATPVTPEEKPVTDPTPETKPESTKENEKPVVEPNKPAKKHHTTTVTAPKNQKNDDKVTEPTVKPADNKVVVEQRTVFATSATDNVSLYSEDGTLVTGRALGKDSAWVTDKLMTLNGVKYVRVSTNEWVKLTDGLEDESIDTAINTKTQASLFTAKGERVTDRALGAETAWRTDRSAMINDQKMYRVSTNEWVKAADIQ